MVPHVPSPPQGRRAVRRAFTLVELLVVIAIIGVLIGVLVPALASARSRAIEVRDTSGIRQLIIAYQTFASEHADAVMVGYLKSVPPEKIEDGYGDLVEGFDGLAKRRYPWRLAQYLDGGLRGTILTGERESMLKTIPAVGQREWWHYRISTMPSFGLNSHFLGGYEFEQTNPPPFRVVRMLSQVRRPSHMLTFASARGEDWEPGVGLLAAEGWHTVDSPAWGHNGPLGGLGYPWSDKPYSDTSNPEEHGNISARYDAKVLMGMIDGHTEAIEPEGLRDMTYWSNEAASSGDRDWKPTVPQ